MKMKFCAVSLSLPPLEWGEHWLIQKSNYLGGNNGLQKPRCPLIVVLGSKRRWGVMEGVAYTSYCQKHV